jgi:hypothetical protein
VAKEHIQPMDVGSDVLMWEVMDQGGGGDTSGEAVVI